MEGIGNFQILRSKCLKSFKSFKSMVGIWFGPNRFFQFGNSSLTLKWVDLSELWEFSHGKKRAGMP